MRAPFPYFGGKSGAAEAVWAAFGVVDNFVEPFAGSAAMLLGAPDGKRVLSRQSSCVARCFYFLNGFRCMVPASRRFPRCFLRIGEFLAKLCHRELCLMLVSKRFPNPCQPHFLFGFFGVFSSNASGRDFRPSLVCVLRSNQRRSGFFSCFLRNNSTSQRLSSCCHRFSSTFYTPMRGSNFFNMLCGKLSSSFCRSHFFSRPCIKNQTGYTLSAICQINQINTSTAIKRNPLLLSRSPISNTGLNNIHKRRQVAGRKFVNPIRFVSSLGFCALDVLGKSSLWNEAPTNIANRIVTRVGEGVNVPSFFNFVHERILQHKTISVVNGLNLISRKGYAITDEAVQNSKDETLWCSPHCVPLLETGNYSLFSEAA